MSRRIHTLIAAAIGVLAVAIQVSDVKPVHGAAPVPADSGSAVHGVNFLLKTVVDETFCVETDVATSATPSVFIAQCIGRANQRWTFTDGVDGSSVVVGDRGLCLMVEHGPKPEKLGIAICDYYKDQRFTVSPEGLIKEKQSDECVTVHSPLVAGNPIFVEECQNPMVSEQIWRLPM